MKNSILLICLFICNIVSANQLINNKIPSQNKFTQAEKEYIQSHTVKYGMIAHNDPFSFKENGKIIGFSYDYINLISKKSGLKIKIEMDNWSYTYSKFKNKKIDFIDLISYTKERENFTSFTQPFFEIPNAIFARKGEIKGYTGLISLKGKKVGITKNIYYYDEIKKLGIFELVEFESSRAKMKALAFEKVDAVFSNLITGQRYIKSTGYANIEVLEELDNKFIKKEDLRIGVNKENQLLFSIIKKAMEDISFEEKEALLHKWFLSTNKREDNKNSVSLAPEEKKYLMSKKEITMCIGPNWMPFERIEDGKHIGLASEYVKIVETSIGIPIRLVKTKNWDDSVKKAINRECDIFSMVPMTKNYQKYMNFTSSYLDIPIVIATKMDKQFIDNVGQILDKKIGIVNNDSIVAILKDKYPNINIVYVKSINDGLRQVENGNIFAFIDNLATINYEIQKRFINTIKVSGRLDTRLHYSMVVRNDEPILHRIFEKIIMSIDNDIKDKIFLKWINPPQREKVVDYTIIWYMFIVLIVLVVLFLYRQYLLKKSNKYLQIVVNDKTKALKELNESLEQKIIREVEKNLHIQKKLFKSEKLASMGEMIGNIAHQWRQPLSVISTGATGMKLQKEFDCLSDEVFNKTCDAINNNAQHLSKTIDDFKNFIKGDREKKIFNLSKNINSFLHLLEGTIKNNDIEIILDLNDNIQINGYENELIQCFINIFNNSKDAIIEEKVRDGLFFITAKIEKDMSIIKIKDNAGGISEKILAKIFEPYFTTKHKSQGTGLGLHMTYNLIVDGMNGTIEAKNIAYSWKRNAYLGTEITITLPIS